MAKVYIHAIFSTKNREPVLADEWRDESFSVLGGSANNIGCQSLIVGGVVDHVHMLFQLARTIGIAEAMKSITASSSAWVNQTRGLAAAFHWQGGYAVFSVSQSNVEVVREYIRRQPEHHAKESFQDELREWLRRYEIEWDERRSRWFSPSKGSFRQPRVKPWARLPAVSSLLRLEGDRA